MRVYEHLQNNKFSLVRDTFTQSNISFTFIHGFLTALATTPHALENIEYEQWLDVLFGKENSFGRVDSHFHEEIFDLYDAISLELRDFEKFMPVIADGNIAYEKASIDDVKIWCDGYVEAMKLFPEVWFEHDLDELHHAIFPILSMTIDDATLTDVLQQEEINQSVTEFHTISVEILPDVIKGLYEDLYWIVESMEKEEAASVN